MARLPLALPDISDPPDPEMTIDEAAKALGRSRDYVTERIKAGVIPGKRVGPNGGRYVIDRAGFEAWRNGTPSINLPLPAALLAPGMENVEVTLEVKVRVTGVRKINQ